jgi:hypothetical protein
MKKLLYIILLLPAWCFGQTDTSATRPGTAMTPSFSYITIGGKRYPNIFQGNQWYGLVTTQQLNAAIAAATPTVTGFTITSLPTIGQVITTGSLNSTFQQLYQQSQPPTASLTGGTTLRISSAATTSANLTYTYGKQTGTQNIASATIGGSTAGITQNANGASGTYTAAVPTNAFTSTTYTLTVTTVDSKTATSSQTFTVQNDRYWFRSASATPDATTITQAAGGGSGLSGSRAGTFVITASGTNYPGFAYPSRLGTLTSIKDANNVEVISGYNTGTISLTNAAGYTEIYRYYINQNATAGSTTMVTQ